METNALPMRLEEPFFPLQEVRANPEHNPNGNRFGTQLHQNIQTTPIAATPGRYGVSLTIESDKDSSENPPYFFALQAYAILNIDTNLDPATQQAIAQINGQTILIGALRERLLDLTSRAPWGKFLLNPIPLASTPAISPPA